MLSLLRSFGYVLRTGSQQCWNKELKKWNHSAGGMRRCRRLESKIALCSYSADNTRLCGNPKYLHLPKSRQTEEEAQEARETIRDCEQFFAQIGSQYYLDMDGPRLMRAIRHMAYSQNEIVGLDIP